MKCKFCNVIAEDLKVLKTHIELDHPIESSKIDDYLLDSDLKIKSIELELIESTSTYRRVRQSPAYAVRKEETL